LSERAEELTRGEESKGAASVGSVWLSRRTHAKEESNRPVSAGMERSDGARDPAKDAIGKLASAGDPVATGATPPGGSGGDKPASAGETPP